MAKRDIIGALFPKPIEFFKSINNSSAFYHDRRVFFQDVPMFTDRMKLHSLIIEKVATDTITYLEFGVWKGQSFNKWTSGHRDAESRFVGFDTFTGLPEAWTADHPVGTFSTDGRSPDVNDGRGTFVKGLFQHTLYNYLRSDPPKGRMIVHVDCDLYSSTLFVLSTVDQFLQPGSILIFDDFHSLNHEYAAWCDYKRAFPHRWKPIGITTACTQVAVELAGW